MVAVNWDGFDFGVITRSRSPQDKEFRWYMWEEGTYRQQQPDESGILKSPFFPGLWLDVSALLAAQMQQVPAVLNSGINSAQHREFVEQLSKNRSFYQSAIAL